MFNRNCSNPASSFGTRLRLSRQRHKLSQKDLGAAINLSNQTILSLEHGRSSPTLREARLLADKLGVHPAWLLLGLPEAACELANLIAALPAAKQDIAVRISKNALEEVELSREWFAAEPRVAGKNAA